MNTKKRIKRKIHNNPQIIVLIVAIIVLIIGAIWLTEEIKSENKSENKQAVEETTTYQTAEEQTVLQTIESESIDGKAAVVETSSYPENLVSATDEQIEDFKVQGVIEYDGWRFTWYSEKVLPGEGLDIPGRWSDGYFVRDRYGYICCASEVLPYGTVLDGPFGKCRVYDCGCDDDVIDLYVSW